MLTSRSSPVLWIARLVVRVVLVAVILSIIVLAVAYLLARQSLPEYSGTHQVDGLMRPVSIVRDAYAVPHIYGADDADVFFGLGYAHAQDRLWQMLLNRATVQGRLSELFGSRSIDFDRRLRVLGLARAAESDYRQLPAEAKSVLRAYTAGVNARLTRISEHPLGRGAPELLLFGGSELEKWRPEDSIGMIKLMAWRLSGGARNEILHARLLNKLLPERVYDLLPPYPDAGLVTVPSAASLPPDHDQQPEALGTADAFAPSLFGEPQLGGASNAWAAHGSRTATGAPLLATDPHLSLSVPGIWYLAHLELTTGGVIGATIPGLPAIVIGRSDKVGWGLTHAYLDDQDIYIEKLDPDNPNLYRTPDGWDTMKVQEEEIHVRGRAEPVILSRQVTRHGPVLPEDLYPLQEAIPPGHVATLRWAATEPGDRTFHAAIRLMRAKSLDTAIHALRDYGAPTQNVTLADQNAIALVVAGRAPLRAADHRTQGQRPAPGWEARNDWQGFIPFAELPRAVRPENGIVANANNRTTSRPFPYHLTHRWAHPYRFRRLQDRLSERQFHTQESFRSIQNDIVSDMAIGLLPLMVDAIAGSTAAPAHPLRADALRRLSQWDGTMDARFPEPLIFVAWLTTLGQQLHTDETQELAGELGGLRPQFVERVLRNISGAGTWCNVLGSEPVETCEEIAASALDEALAQLENEYGSSVASWRWGRAHPAVHSHLPLGYFGRIPSWMFNLEHESSGGNYTLQRAQHRGNDVTGFQNVHAAGYRAIYNFAAPRQSDYIAGTGQSGHFLSPHYRDLNELWQVDGYLPMSMDRSDVDVGSVGTLQLIPTLDE